MKAIKINPWDKSIKDRSIGAAGSGKTRKKTAEPVVPMDLKAWLG